MREACHISRTSMTLFLLDFLRKVRGLASYEKTSPGLYKRAVEISDTTLQNLSDLGIKVVFQGRETVELGRSTLYLMNHHLFGLETFFPYSFLPENSRIVMDEWLIKIPFFGKGFNALNPIIFKGENINGRLESVGNKTALRDVRNVSVEILNSLTQEERPVMIYPEGTRSNLTDDVLPFTPVLRLLFREAVKLPTQNDFQIVSIVHRFNDVVPFYPTRVWRDQAVKGKILLDFKTFPSFRKIYNDAGSPKAVSEFIHTDMQRRLVGIKQKA